MLYKSIPTLILCLIVQSSLAQMVISGPIISVSEPVLIVETPISWPPTILQDPLNKSPLVSFNELAPESSWPSYNGSIYPFRILDFGQQTDPEKKKLGEARIRNLTMSDGKFYRNVLWTHPNWTHQKGAIEGRFPIDIPVDAGKFIAMVGLAKGATKSDGVKFSFGYMHSGSSTERTEIKSQNVKYANGMVRFEVDMLPYRGKYKNFYLRVDVAGTSSQDWAAWWKAGIYSAKDCRVGIDLRPIGYQIIRGTEESEYAPEARDLKINVRIANVSNQRHHTSVLSRVTGYDYLGNAFEGSIDSSMYQGEIASNSNFITQFHFARHVRYHAERICNVKVEINTPYDSGNRGIWERDYNNNEVWFKIRDCDNSDALPDLQAQFLGTSQMGAGSVTYVKFNLRPSWHIQVYGGYKYEVFGVKNNGEQVSILDGKISKYYIVNARFQTTTLAPFKKLILKVDPDNIIAERNENNNQDEIELDDLN